ncbi:hypothetical protein JM18_000551 [Phytophthora kernoviae]|uniref:Uncharacterized protein n=2 Tax=Phytophthora kernoviae TaxID=325452 RepID=A0A921VG95_9STRA|nr:hypothetical protein JM18_000551 [Phytophthora kernoviae]
MLTKDQAQDQLASLYLRAKVARLESKTRRRAVEYVNSTLGVAHFERTARVLAHEMSQCRRRLRKLYKKHEKSLRQIEMRREKLHRKIETFQRAKAARLQTTRDKCERLVKDRAALERERDIASAKDKDGALAAIKTKKLGKVDDKLAKLRDELELGESEFGGPESAKIAELELAIEGLDMVERKLAATIVKAKVREVDADLDEEESEDADEEDDEDNENEDNESEEDSNDNDDGDDNSEDSDESEEENAPEKETPKVNSTDPAVAPSNPFFQIDMPDLNIEDYRKAAVKAVDAELEKRLITSIGGAPTVKATTTLDTTKQKFTMPSDVPEEELLELFQTQIRSSTEHSQVLSCQAVWPDIFVCEEAKNGKLLDYLFRKRENDRALVWRKLLDATRAPLSAPAAHCT